MRFLLDTAAVGGLWFMPFNGGPWFQMDAMTGLMVGIPLDPVVPNKRFIPKAYWATADTWDVPGYGLMKTPEYGNYLAGYAAGFGSGLSAYWPVRLLGVEFASLGDIVQDGQYGESWKDEKSVPFIDCGYKAGRQARSRSWRRFGP